MSKYNPIKIKTSNIAGASDSDNIFYNISIYNDDRIGNAPAQAIFSEIRNNPFLSNPSEYYMSVVRFDTDTSTLPVLMPVRNDTNNTETPTIYAVGMTYRYNTGGPLGDIYFFQTTNIDPFGSVPQIQGISKSNKFLSNQIFNYEWFINQINYAMNLCLQNLQNQVTAYNTAHPLDPPIPFPNTQPPVMTWDNNTYKATLNFDYSTPQLWDSIFQKSMYLYFNQALFNLFNSFTFIQTLDTSSQPQFDGYNWYQITVLKMCNNLKDAKPEGSIECFHYPTITLTQDTSTISYWSPIDSLVYTVSFLPVNPEVECIPKILNGSNPGNNSNVINYLTDYQSTTKDLTPYKPRISYEPTAEYRLTDLVGNIPISNIEIKIFWKDHFGNLYPLTLASGSSASLKLLFRRKELYGTQIY